MGCTCACNNGSKKCLNGAHKLGNSPLNIQPPKTASRSQRFDLFFQLLDFLSQPSRSLAQGMTFALKPNKVLAVLP
jgi:hypothetical protein